MFYYIQSVDDHADDSEDNPGRSQYSYKMYTADIGSANTQMGYHGYIAMTIYVKEVLW